MKVFGKGNVLLRVNLRVTAQIEDRLRAELIQPKIIRYLTEFEEKWSRVLQS